MGGLALQSGAGLGGFHRFAAIEGSKTAAEFLIKFGNLSGASPIVLFEKPKSLPDYLARRVVAPGLNLGADEFFKLGRERDVHNWWCSQPTLYSP
ncbi:hypothetical protein SBA3_670034 [Candidatus Sulfopaludibacter sp. SbA3]|nr:hypothetical protein SBA3_670034 [Candidatus Sulfopaludibacter sp. SbA3]